MPSFWFVLALLSVTLPLYAAKPLDAQQQSLLSLQGHWFGQMEFIEPGSGRLVRQPLQLQVSASIDNSSLFIHRQFSSPDLAIDTFTIRTLTNPAQVAYVRGGRLKTFQSQTVALQQLSQQSWILVQEHHDTEGDRPITVRYTLRRSGDSFSNTKEVDYRDDKQQLWQLRYRSAYQRHPDNVLPQAESPPSILGPQRRGYSRPLPPVL
ncbi:hypothetical protein [Ferrimonas senticii]|uniref:hypothetical protein n=1 Tax=Ferrimonas senticii TaxID=394566 RepID=UPI0004880DA4|nr:hypothetical protein [Ferrimonas senticii]